jgi:Family of unknown function (DUF6979)
MPIFGTVAVLATQIATSGNTSPEKAWGLAVAQATKSLSMRAKGCPRSAYLGLCESGRVVGIRAGTYASRPGGENARYALEAYELLRFDPTLDAKLLWAKIPARTAVNPNNQMDVVLALWKAGLLH